MALGIISPDELGRACWDTDAITSVAYTGTSARNSTDLAKGAYYVIATTACFFKQGTSSVDATTSSNYLPANTPVLVKVTGTANARIAAIRLTESGTFYVMQPTGG